MQNAKLTRRNFLKASALAAGALAFPLNQGLAQSQTRYRRFNVMSAGGQKALASYAKGVDAMLKLPPAHPQNWFRNAFIHLMDCPHGNWWFYVWHRGYLGYFEETIRNLSGDAEFALPYWDWTTQPQIPDSMFTGVLTPTDKAYEPYTGNLAIFTTFIQSALTQYWNSLNNSQLAQLKLRGYTSFDLLWNDVTGYSPANKYGISGNMAYAVTGNARYLSRENPKLDAKTAYDVSPFVVYAGLLPTDFYNRENDLSFTSAQTSSHNAQPGGPNTFSVLEGLPHNIVHNCIGGVGPLDPGPYGFMTNFLSAADPIFYLHHANIDRLWDVWTRKQKSLGLPWLPTGRDLDVFSNDPFLFFVDGNGQYITDGRAGDFRDTDRFAYDYEPGFGENVIHAPNPSLTVNRSFSPLVASVQTNTASVSLPVGLIEQHLASTMGPVLIAQITLPRPDMNSSVTREFDVVIGEPADAKLTSIKADSPYYGGTIAFFGNMSGMQGMPMSATFAVPLPRRREAFTETLSSTRPPITIRVVPSQGNLEAVPALESVVIHRL